MEPKCIHHDSLSCSSRDLEKYNKLSTHKFIPQIKEITNTLRNVGVSYFSYFEIDLINWSFISLINNDEIGKYFVQNNGLEMEQVFFFQQKKEGFYSLKELTGLNKKQINYFKNRMEISSLIDIITLIEYDKNTGIARQCCYGISNLVLYSLENLKLFNIYFRDKATDLINCSDRILIQKKDTAAACSTDKNWVSTNEFISQSIKRFHDDIDFYHYKLHKLAIKHDLSQRELQCIDLIVHNNLNKQTSYQLGLSQRTVEFYITRLRKKIGCKNKLELILKLYNTV